MKKRLELSDGSSNKFWEVEVSGATVTVTFGKLGTDGQSKPKKLGSAAEATKEAEKLIAEKTRKGYSEVGAAEKPPKAAEKPAKPARPAAGASGASVLPPKLIELIGGSCFYSHEDVEEDLVVFDWWALPANLRDELLADVFNDCDVPGDYPTLIGPSDTGTQWINRECVPFALAGVQNGFDVLGADGGIPQFHRMLLIDAAGAAYAIEVDGTATPAQEPEKIAKSWDKLKIKKRPPAKPVVQGALPKVKTTKHVRLVSSWGQFEPPARDTAMVRDIQLSADGKLAVLSIRSDKPAECGARVHRVETGELVRHLGNEHGGVAISPDGSLVITTHGIYDNGRAHLGACWDVATGKQRWEQPVQRGDGLVTLQISPDGETLYASCAGHGIKAYKLSDGAPLWEHKIAKGQFDNHAHAITFSPDGALTTAGADGVIRIWDTKTRKVTTSIKAEDAVEDIAWLPDGKRLVSHSSHLTAIWDVATGKVIKKLREWDRRTAADIGVSSVGLMIGCSSDGKIDVWTLDGELVEQLDLKGKVGAWCLAPCPGGFAVGTGGACALRFELTP
ncbi:MAG: WGR domain-containing protein [Nannocystis sp.]|nr:WGR domain-containing protein [Nannocystis sp.]MBA3547713.1 WGR domain-containing protein [Nannocystis sp.]